MATKKASEKAMSKKKTAAKTSALVTLASRHNYIDAVKSVFAAMRAADTIDVHEHAAALYHVAMNEVEVAEMCEHSSISDVAWFVIDVVWSVTRRAARGSTSA